MKRYSLWVKCLVFFLAVVTLLGVAVSGLGILVAESMSMYTQESYEEFVHNQYRNLAETVADQVIRDYGSQLSACPQWLLEYTGYQDPIEHLEGWFELSEDDWYYTIRDASGKVVRDTKSARVKDPVVFIFERSAEYPVIIEREASVIDPSMAATEAVAFERGEMDVTTPTEAPVEYRESFWDPDTGEEVWIGYQTEHGYQVTVGITQNHSCYYTTRGLSSAFVKNLFELRHILIISVAVSLLLFVVVFVFLVSIAGRSPENGEISPKALNRLPLDLYLAAAVFITVLGLALASEMLDMLFDKDSYNVLVLVLLCGCGIVVATTDVGFFTALAAQCKLPDRFWWRHSVFGRIYKWLWKGIKFICKGTVMLFSMLPLIWEWLLIAFGLALGLFITMLITFETGFVLILLWWCLIGVLVVGYGGYCYGTIRKGICRMKEGNLYEKIKTDYMIGSFKSIAENLNALADVAAIAAEKQLRSERMKTELITNVSHDIKTPLTSVINYVDLLQQPHTEEEGQQYLEVLSRQSLRLKKLVEDLMDMSKASTGNVVVNVTSVDAVETVNQALGEFADKLEAANLTPVFRPAMPQMHMLADGKLTWRVLSNLLGNVVKYALPGTRVYLDLLRVDKQVVLSIKNISREELNISADELTERFVRGDASRNTEGSGLGLNIAQSLMRLQRGDLEITVDGDLFKVTLTFLTE